MNLKLPRLMDQISYPHGCWKYRLVCCALFTGRQIRKRKDELFRFIAKGGAIYPVLRTVFGIDKKTLLDIFLIIFKEIAGDASVQMLGREKISVLNRVEKNK